MHGTQTTFLFKQLFVVIPLTLVLLATSACDFSNSTAGAGRINQPNQDPDPVVVDQPIAYIQRPIPVDDMNTVIIDDMIEPDTFHPGAQLVIKARSKSDAPEIIVTEGVFPDQAQDPDDPDSPLVAPLYDVKDLDVSPNGNKLLFSMRAPEIPNADDDEQPTWNIWQYDRINDKLERLIISDITAEGGQDVGPRYLPNGKIVFSSNRQRRTRAILLDEGKPQYAGQTEDRRRDAYVLHVLDPNLQEIEQITFNPSHDLQPTVLTDGRVMFLRWDSSAGHDRLSLYTVNPDGTNASLLYGYDSQNTGTNDIEAVFYRTMVMPDGRVLAVLRPRESGRYGGEIIAIDTLNFTEIDLSTANGSSNSMVAQESLSPGEVRIDDELSPLGFFNSAYPLFDNTNRFLVSWSQCRLVNVEEGTIVPCTPRFRESSDYIEAVPDYGLWILDFDAGTQLPVKAPNDLFMFTEAKLLTTLPTPSAYEETPDEDLLNEGVGSLHIRNVYDIDGTDTSPSGIGVLSDPLQTPASERSARFIRIFKPVPMPDRDVRDFDNLAFGLGGVRYMRDIIGYVPIEPDGSAKFKVPADIPFSIELLNAQGKALAGQSHNNWLTLRAGEQRECSGCHTRDSRVAHGRPDAEPDSAYAGAIGDINFTNTVLIDPFDTPHPGPIAEQTMAEYYASVNSLRSPSIDLLYTDEWTDTRDPDSGLVKADDIVASYANIQTTRDPNCAPLETIPSVWVQPSTCRSVRSAAANVDTQWNALCRITINYLDSIQPLWEKDRRSCNDIGEIVEDRTCTSCHNIQSADGMAQLPGGNLELTGEISAENMDYVSSYVDLTNGDVLQHLVNGNLLDYAIEDPDLVLELGPDGEILNPPSGLFQRDPDTGALILDANGLAIPLYSPIPVLTNQTLRPQVARNNDYFFNMFEVGFNDMDHTVNHKDFLSVDELKLIAEWLDAGAQYYNNPFDAPEN